jgi:hypothetical protein
LQRHAKLDSRRTIRTTGRKAAYVEDLPNRRLRWPDELCPRLRKWLTRVQRVQAHMRTTLAIYAKNSNIGGAAGNNNYLRRVATGDRTILHDVLALAIDEYGEIFHEVQAFMDSAEPTTARPGTREKVDVMERRANEGYSIFIADDAKL